MRVFLTSDSVRGSDMVRSILTSQGHEVQEPVSAGAGALLAGHGWTADAVVAVFLASRPPPQRLGAVLVEIGIALGRRVPVLVVAKPSLTMPFLSGTPRVDYGGDGDLLAAQLGLLLHGVEMGSPGSGSSHPASSATPSTSTTRSVPSSAGPSLRSAQLTGLEFEQAVSDVLASTGAEVLQEGQRASQPDRADFTLYFPSHPKDLGVVLVEAKSFVGHPDHPRDPATRRRALREAAYQLSLQVISTGAGLGVLVYDGHTQHVPPTPLTVAISLEELARLLTERPLDEVLRRARNEAIHGL
jgi:hypothetical protein